MKSGVKIPLIALFFITTATPAGVPLRAVIPSALYAQTGTDAAGEAIEAVFADGRAQARVEGIVPDRPA